MILWTILALAGVGVAVWLLWSWSGSPRQVARSGVTQVLAAVGPARCLAATALLRRLAAGGDQIAIHAAIDAIELPLVEAIPDCPPDAKPALSDALDACAAQVRQRDLAKRITTLRNALLSG